MNLEQAITTAIEFEQRVHATYVEAVKETEDPAGKRVFGVLAREELEHIQYLEGCLETWKKEGKLDPAALDTALPTVEQVQQGVEKVKNSIAKESAPRPKEIEVLRRAIKVESETTAFYQKMVDELGDDGAFFARFLEIEQGHLAMVNAELDSVSGMGYWFDMAEWRFADG